MMNDFSDPWFYDRVGESASEAQPPGPIPCNQGNGGDVEKSAESAPRDAQRKRIKRQFEIIREWQRFAERLSKILGCSTLTDDIEAALRARAAQDTQPPAPRDALHELPDKWHAEVIHLLSLNQDAAISRAEGVEDCETELRAALRARAADECQDRVHAAVVAERASLELLYGMRGAALVHRICLCGHDSEFHRLGTCCHTFCNCPKFEQVAIKVRAAAPEGLRNVLAPYRAMNWEEKLVNLGRGGIALLQEIEAALAASVERGGK